MDSVLQCLYNLRKLKILPGNVFNLDKTLSETLDLIKTGDFSQARLNWLTILIPDIELSDEVEFRDNSKKVDLKGDTFTYTKSCTLFK